ncbi:NADPH:quinone reductase-like Zn-dependent oxidoreductase [Chitinophaga sp. W2I13]|uniref:alcohol dehydrogenase catalytic domain-containing protein n=1 Tax=Chitinophaga sp. W2I13 TaxID=3373923 RepID=UPI003D244949
MKAMQYKAFGGSEVIEQVEVATPSIQNENDVLIQVKAASVNPIDMKIRMGFMKQIRPVEMPFIPGGEVAGIVVATGEKVSKFKAGDEVIAIPLKNGYAQFVVANENFVVPKPQSLSFEEAASIGVRYRDCSICSFYGREVSKRPESFNPGWGRCSWRGYGANGKGCRCICDCHCIRRRCGLS